jgi:hypothetical protein
MKTATAYLRGDFLYLHSDSKSTSWVWVAGPPFIKLNRSCSHNEKATAVCAVLESSRESIPHPTDWSAVTAPLLRLAGVKSDRQLVKNAMCVHLQLDRGQLKFVPCKNLGAREGFDFLMEESIDLPISSTPDEIGAGLDEAISRCR